MQKPRVESNNIEVMGFQISALSASGIAEEVVLYYAFAVHLAPPVRLVQ